MLQFPSEIHKSRTSTLKCRDNPRVNEEGSKMLCCDPSSTKPHDHPIPVQMCCSDTSMSRTKRRYRCLLASPLSHLITLIHTGTVIDTQLALRKNVEFIERLSCGWAFCTFGCLAPDQDSPSRSQADASPLREKEKDARS
jgi:hypothetical protein